MKCPLSLQTAFLEDGDWVLLFFFHFFRVSHSAGYTIGSEEVFVG